MNFLNELQLNSFKGVPPLTLILVLGLQQGGQNHEKTVRKRRGKSEGTKRENAWSELQSARAGAVETHFSTFLGKPEISSKMHVFGLPFSVLLCTFFMTFP